MIINKGEYKTCCNLIILKGNCLHTCVVVIVVGSQSEGGATGETLETGTMEEQTFSAQTLHQVDPVLTEITLT